MQIKQIKSTLQEKNPMIIHIKKIIILILSFFGAENFSGQEIVYKDEKPCWSMNYYGRVIGKNFNGDFLKEVLLQVDEKLPYRGPLFY